MSQRIKFNKSYLDLIKSAPKFVLRTTEVASQDMIKTDFIDNTNWNGLDMTGFDVPITAVAVYLRMFAQDNVVNSYCRFRKTGFTSTTHGTGLRINVANHYGYYQFIVPYPCEVNIGPKPTSWTNLRLIVIGWWL